MHSYAERVKRLFLLLGAKAIARPVTAVPLALLIAMLLCGCSGWAPTDPAGALGRWKPKPVQQRILQTLTAAEESEHEEFANAEDPTPEDLQLQPEDYTIGSGDTIDIQIFELLAPDTPYQERVQVDDLGFITIQHVGQVKAAGLTSVQLTEQIKEVLYPNILKDPRVGVTAIGRTHRTYAIMGAVREPLRYFIDKPNYRLLDALAQAQDIVQTNIPYIYVIRQQAAEVSTTAERVEQARRMEEPILAEPAKVGPPEISPEEQLEELLKAIPGKTVPQGNQSDSGVVHFSEVGWTRGSGRFSAQKIRNREKTEHRKLAESKPMTSQKEQQQAKGRGFYWPPSKPAQRLPFAGRVIRVPLDALRAGNANYNILIRNDDVIHVPLTEAGFYYMMGNINRPGTYQIGVIPVTLTRAIAAAGSIGPLAEPSKVDITRRIGNHKQEIVQVDLAKIFAGLQPDYYIKADDIINVGTSPVSPWLAVIRNGFRATYGFGFVYDRNYADRDFGRPFELPNLLFW